ncbi:MAG: flagellar protein FlaG [Acetatifactor sp.]|nr:flagellar protein FlaG [Acetatifactor sp.]
MAIEPISSIMTVQAQGSVQKPQAPVQAEKPENVSDSVQAAVKVDKTINVVENAQEKGQADGGEQQGKDQQATHDQIRKAVEQLNKNLGNSEAVFGIHEDTNRVTIKIVDKTTKEVIRELPPEKTLDMIAKVWDLAGILIDEKR